MADNDNGVSGIGWFLAGLGVGALIGVLYAPKSGAETRSDILAASLEAKDKARDLAKRGVEQLGDYVDSGKEYYERGRTQWSQYADKGKSMIQDQQNRVAAAID